MSGYAGPDDESLHAIILSENGIEASRRSLIGRVLTHCRDCGEEIPKQRQAAGHSLGMKIEYCIRCQEHHDEIYQPKMLTKML